MANLAIFPGIAHKQRLMEKLGQIMRRKQHLLRLPHPQLQPLEPNLPAMLALITFRFLMLEVT